MLWQRSPQYQNMPHDQYMKTAEGQQSRQALQNWEQWQRQRHAAPQKQPPAGQQAPTNQSGGKPPDMSAYKPGAAQPVQSQSRGTPYGAYSGDVTPETYAAWQRGDYSVGRAPEGFITDAVYAKGTSQGYMQQNPDTRYAAPQKTAAPSQHGVTGFLGPARGMDFIPYTAGEQAMAAQDSRAAVDARRAKVEEYNRRAKMTAQERKNEDQFNYDRQQREKSYAAPPPPVGPPAGRSGSSPPQMPDAVYAQGTDPGYMQANPDDMPFRPGVRGDAMGYPRPSNTAFADAWNSAPMMGMEPTSRTPAYSFGGEGPGNLAYMPEGFRPPPFQAAFQNFDGSVTDTPLFGQRDAFIQNINDRDFQYMAGMEQGRPMYDIGSMLGQAGDMVAGGWQNPLAGLFNYG